MRNPRGFSPGVAVPGNNLFRACPLPGPDSAPQNGPGKTRAPGCFADHPIFHLSADGTIVEGS